MTSEAGHDAGLVDATELMRRTLSANYRFCGSVREFRAWLRRQNTNGGDAECWAERTS